MRKAIKETFGNTTRVRACGLCVKNDSLLLVKHEGLGPRGWLWAPPGGGIECGQTAEATLKREMLEETGVKIKVDHLVFVNEFIQKPLHAIELFFSIRITSGQLITGIDPEMKKNEQIIKEVRFVTFQEIAIMNKEILHNVLHQVTSEKTLLNMSGYFKFSR